MPIDNICNPFQEHPIFISCLPMPSCFCPLLDILGLELKTLALKACSPTAILYIHYLGWCGYQRFCNVYGVLWVRVRLRGFSIFDYFILHLSWIFIIIIFTVDNII